MLKDYVLEKIDTMKKNGYTEEEVAKFFGYNVKELREAISKRHRENRIVLRSKAKELKEAGKSTRETATELGVNESTVRLLLDDEINDKLE